LPKIASLNKDLEGMVVKTTKMKIESKKRAESAKNKDAIKEIESFESIEGFYESSKKSIIFKRRCTFPRVVVVLW
jgi:hypothetical protein